jgi:peptide/nickel transport system substrate-binding protein
MTPASPRTASRLLPHRAPGRLVRAGGLLALLVATASHGAPLRYAEDRAPGIVNPVYATTMSEARLNELVFEGLFTDSQELASVPQLASDATISPDKKAMRIRLRTDVTWHDGRPFTARDVVFTITAMKDPNVGSPEAGRVAWIESAEAIDEHTVELRFGQPEYAPEDKLHFKILPAHPFQGDGISRTHPFRSRPVGTGPWKVQAFEEDNSITLARYADHWADPGIEQVVMREVADKNYQAKLLVYESLETLVRVLPRDLATLQNDRKTELYPYQTNSWWYVGFNNRRAPFDDPRVREALSLMVDVPALLEPIGTGDRVTGPFVPSSPFYNHDVPAREPDPDRARQLLEEAGFTRTERTWEKDGAPLKLEIATLKNLETAQDVLINLQTQLKNAGVQVETTFVARAAWKQKVWGQKDFDLILSQWSFDRNEDIYEQFHSEGARNFVGYADEEVDELLDRARATTDPLEKRVLLQQVHEKVSADTPMVFLWTLDSYAAMSTKVQDVVVHPFYFFTFARSWSLR